MQGREKGDGRGSGRSSGRGSDAYDFKCSQSPTLIDVEEDEREREGGGEGG